MRIGYFDCFSGAAGDMILAAAVDAGWPLDALRAVVERLGLAGVSVSAERVTRGGIAATHVRVSVDERQQSDRRHLPEIIKLIVDADLPAAVAQNALIVFQRLAEAEAAVHGIEVEQVHFHEVGATDALVDIVGACAGLAALGLERIVCSPVPTGYGTVTCAHGVLPVPAPATAELLRGVPLAACDEQAELVTPTGAAILTTLAEGFGPLPPMRLARVGYGAGTRAGQRRPNLLRLLIGDAAQPTAADRDEVVVLEAQVDDATGQAVAHACERLLAGGALDAFIVPIIMKKGRPGQLVTALCRPEDADALADLLLAETSTLGVRRTAAQRTKLPREVATVDTRFGPIRVKVAQRATGGRRAWPEYEDCASAARAAGVPLVDVQQEALRAWAQQDDP